jgi:MoxR-like ATPase
MGSGVSTQHDPPWTGAAGAPLPPWWLTVVHHPDPRWLGARVRIEHGLTLGRSGRVLGDGTLEDERVSRNHARFDVDGAAAPTVVDLGSRNGTTLNGRRVERAELDDGDVIGLGRILLLVHRRAADRPADRPAGSTGDELLDGVSAARAELLAAIERVAAHTTTALLVGETGAGKDRVAAALHRRSGRAGELIAVACAAIPDEHAALELLGAEAGAAGNAPARTGLLERAAGGSLLLDGVDGAPPAMQAALLRFLERGEVRPLGAAAPRFVDVRVIATSPCDPGELAARGLRPELISRLARFVLPVPPLRQRLDDVPHLAAAFARRYAGADRSLDAHLALHLVRNGWPHNVRGLEAVIERAVIDADPEGPLRLTRGVAALLAPGQRAIGGEPATPPTLPPVEGCVLARSGRWFRIGDERVGLETRRALPHLLAALIEAREQRPGRALTVDDLVARGWPGERVLGEAGANRVYVALTTLRKLGLRDLLQRTGDGYYLPPGADVTIVDE